MAKGLDEGWAKKEIGLVADIGLTDTDQFHQERFKPIDTIGNRYSWQHIIYCTLHDVYLQSLLQRRI